VGEFQLPRELSGPILEEAERAGPEEACGLIVGRRRSNRVRATRTVSCDNLAPPEARARRFEIDPRLLIEVERAVRDTDEEVVGFYHSHPDSEPIPSELDSIYMALWPDKVWLIVGQGAGDEGQIMRAWSLDLADQGSLREVRLVSIDTVMEGQIRQAKV